MPKKLSAVLTIAVVLAAKLSSSSAQDVYQQGQTLDMRMRNWLETADDGVITRLENASDFGLTVRELNVWNRLRLGATSFARPAALREMSIGSVAVLSESMDIDTYTSLDSHARDGVFVGWLSEDSQLCPLEAWEVGWCTVADICSDYIKIKFPKSGYNANGDGGGHMVLFSFRRGDLANVGGGNYLFSDE